jgi:hypothetical protein
MVFNSGVLVVEGKARVDVRTTVVIEVDGVVVFLVDGSVVCGSAYSKIHVNAAALVDSSDAVDVSVNFYADCSTVFDGSNAVAV